MKNFLWKLFYAAILTAGTVAYADYLIDPGSTSTVKAFVCETTKICAAHVNVKSDGTEIFTAGNPGVVSGVGVAQGSTTSGQTLSPVGFATLAAAPTYTDAQTNLPTLTTKGAQRVDQYSTAGTALVADPCQTVAKTFTPINISTTANVQLVAAAASKKTYVCHMFLTSFGTNNVAVVEGTGGTCASGTAGVIGGIITTAGIPLVANGGFSVGNGVNAVWATASTNIGLCLIPSATSQLSGMISWVQQ